ncbi:hypothetical protein ACWGJP_03380 [Microbacterium sp. NPDC055903]
MTSPTRLLLTSVIAAGALLLAGCATDPGTSAPTSSTEPSSAAQPSSAPEVEDGFEAAWLDEGRMFAVVSWGSSTCIPSVDTVEAQGQQVAVTLVDVQGEDAVCTADLAPRASIGALPEGVDPSKDVELVVTYGEFSDDADLEGDATLIGIPGEPTEYAPSAGWFDDESLVLLTWGSSSCPPVVESVEGSGAAGTVTFVTDEAQACTQDMAPRATIVAFPDDSIEDDGFQLTLAGGGLDGTVAVRG